jgi:hypothetical protein
MEVIETVANTLPGHSAPTAAVFPITKFSVPRVNLPAPIVLTEIYPKPTTSL